MSVKAVLFDIDGTLVDSNDLHILAWQEAFRGEGHEFDAQVLHDQIGKGADNLVPTLLPGSDEATAERLGDAHGKVFKERYLSQVKPFPHARDLLARVHGAGRQVVLASSASKEELDHYVDLLDVRALLAATTSIDDVGTSKPAPDIFSTALGKLDGVEAGEAVAVGDSPYDAESAGKCGIRTVGLRSGGFPDEALQKAGAVAVYDDVAALLAGYDASPLS